MINKNFQLALSSSGAQWKSSYELVDLQMLVHYQHGKSEKRDK